jgi:hypothetical protein
VGRCLSAAHDYAPAFECLSKHFAALPPVLNGQTLLELLFAPLRTHPDSIDAQLRFLLEQWGELAAPFAHRILTTLDIIGEETKATFSGPVPPWCPTIVALSALDEYEAFSADKEWMPKVVLLAKNTYVWLDNSRKSMGITSTGWTWCRTRNSTR